MSNYSASCFYRIDFFVIPSYIELPWCKRSCNTRIHMWINTSFHIWLSPNLQSMFFVLSDMFSTTQKNPSKLIFFQLYSQVYSRHFRIYIFSSLNHGCKVRVLEHVQPLCVLRSQPDNLELNTCFPSYFEYPDFRKSVFYFLYVLKEAAFADVLQNKSS